MSGQTTVPGWPPDTDLPARNVVIRPSREADMPAIQRIYAHHVMHGFGSFEEEPPDLAELMRRRGEYLSRRLPYLVAELDGRVVGYAYAGPYRPRPGYSQTVEDSIYVAADMARRGIGRALLRRLIAEAEAMDFRQMVAVIGDSRLAGSIALHASEGFTVVARMPTLGHKFGMWLDTVMMQRPLGRGGTAPPAV